jgi:hypothetical protein
MMSDVRSSLGSLVVGFVVVGAISSPLERRQPAWLQVLEVLTLWAIVLRHPFTRRTA